MDTIDIIRTAINRSPNSLHALGASERIMNALDAAGYVIVPKKPTKLMTRSAERYGDSEGYGSVGEIEAECIWDDMINAWVNSLSDQ